MPLLQFEPLCETFLTKMRVLFARSNECAGETLFDMPRLSQSHVLKTKLILSILLILALIILLYPSG